MGEIENIIPDYTHQSQTVVASNGGAISASSAHGSRGSRAPTSGALIAAAAPAVPPPPPVGRLADNGLSASSTSTATSSPDSNKSTSLAAIAISTSGSSAAAVAASPQVSSRRMDTYTVDTPSTASHQQQFRSYADSNNYGTGGQNYRTTAASVALQQQQRNSKLAGQEPAQRRAASTTSPSPHQRPSTIPSSNGQQHNKRFYDGPTPTMHNQLQPATRRSSSSGQQANPMMLQYQNPSSEQAPNAIQPYEIYREQPIAANYYIDRQSGSQAEPTQLSHQSPRPTSDDYHNQYQQQQANHDNHFYSPFLPQTSALTAMKVV